MVECLFKNEHSTVPPVSADSLTFLREKLYNFLRGYIKVVGSGVSACIKHTKLGPRALFVLFMRTMTS